MSNKEIEIAIRIAEAIKVLPVEKKERWLGYAEGVVDMANRHHEDKFENIVQSGVQRPTLTQGTGGCEGP